MDLMSYMDRKLYKTMDEEPTHYIHSLVHMPTVFHKYLISVSTDDSGMNNKCEVPMYTLHIP